MRAERSVRNPVPDMPMPKRTPLFDLHLADGARMVEFAGWEMPLHYGSQLLEHEAVRRRCGVFDVSHMRVADLDGPGAGDFLGCLLANDVGTLGPGRALYSCMLREDGGILDDLIVYRLAEEATRFRLVVNAATADADLAWMQGVAAARRLEPGLRARGDLALLAVQGPQAREHVAGAVASLAAAAEALPRFAAVRVGDFFLARTGYTGEDGFEIALPAPQAPALWQALRARGVAACGLGARDTLRLEAGLNLYGKDMDASVTPYECALAWTVHLEGGRDFIGRAALQRAAGRDDLRQLLGLQLLDRGVLRDHQDVHTARGAGVVTSGGFSPTMGRSIALARLPAGVRQGDEVRVDLRGRAAPALVCRPPFVRHGRVLVEAPSRIAPGATP